MHTQNITTYKQRDTDTKYMCIGRNTHRYLHTNKYMTTHMKFWIQIHTHRKRDSKTNTGTRAIIQT